MIPSLQEACFYFIVNHIASYTAASLALLPSHVRLRLISYAPAIDLWRLDKSPAFCRGLTVDEEWRTRVATHITAWKTPKGLEFNEREATFRESYLRYTQRLLFTSTGSKLMQGPSAIHNMEFEGENGIRKLYDYRKQFSFHLRRANLQPSNGLDDPKLLPKHDYIHFLFYGVHIETAQPEMLKYTAFKFDSQEKYYHFPHHYAADMKFSTLSLHHHTPCPWFQKMITVLKATSGWMPKKLEIVTPSYDFLNTILCESVSEFLSSVEEIDVNFFNDVGFIEVADVLTKLFEMNKLSAESICIKTRYEYQVTWLLPRLAAVCGRLSPCDQLLFPHLPDQQHANGYCGVRNITISTHSDGIQMSSSDWGVVMFQDKLKSITLRACIPTNFPYLLSHLLATRPSLRLIDLTGCWNDYNSLQLLVSTFLFAFTDHPQSLIIRELPPGTGVKTQQGQGSDTEIELPAKLKVSGPCRSGEHKTLCLPFISSGPCSLAWLLSLPELSLKGLNLTVREENHTSCLNAIHLIFKSHPYSLFHCKCTIFICCKSQFPSQLRSRVITQLRMCPQIKNVCFIAENNI